MKRPGLGKVFPAFYRRCLSLTPVSNPNERHPGQREIRWPDADSRQLKPSPTPDKRHFRRHHRDELHVCLQR